MLIPTRFEPIAEKHCCLCQWKIEHKKEYCQALKMDIFRKGLAKSIAKLYKSKEALQN